MVIHPVGPDYEETVGAVHGLRRAGDGAQPGDPARAARVVVDVVRSADPPRRLVLGSDALTLARRAGEVRAAETEQWAEVSRSTDYAGG